MIMKHSNSTCLCMIPICWLCLTESKATARKEKTRINSLKWQNDQTLRNAHIAFRVTLKHLHLEVCCVLSNPGTFSVSVFSGCFCHNFWYVLCNNEKAILVTVITNHTIFFAGILFNRSNGSICFHTSYLHHFLYPWKIYSHFYIKQSYLNSSPSAELLLLSLWVLNICLKAAAVINLDTQGSFGSERRADCPLIGRSVVWSLAISVCSSMYLWARYGARYIGCETVRG